MSIQLKDCVRLEFGTTDNPTNGILLCTLYIKYPNGAVLSISPRGEPAWVIPAVPVRKTKEPEE